MNCNDPCLCPNHPFVVWGACFLWLISIFEIVWSLLLFFCVGDILLLTGTDLVNAIVLLSGIIMLPTNMHMLYAISHNCQLSFRGHRTLSIVHDAIPVYGLAIIASRPGTKVVCCPLWLCIAWIILINVVGSLLCLQRIYSCHYYTYNNFYNGMAIYKTKPKYKRIIDNIQWSLQCCGFKSYHDWFTKDWFDPRDFATNERRAFSTREVDSVPFSCCKTGLCMPNYLKVLGSNSINTPGCGRLLFRIIVISMTSHIFIFLAVIVVECLLLKFISSDRTKNDLKVNRRNFNVRHIMSVNNNFEFTSRSCQMDPEESDTSDPKSPASEVNME